MVIALDTFPLKGSLLGVGRVSPAHRHKAFADRKWIESVQRPDLYRFSVFQNNPDRFLAAHQLVKQCSQCPLLNMVQANRSVCHCRRRAVSRPAACGSAATTPGTAAAAVASIGSASQT